MILVKYTTLEGRVIEVPFDPAFPCKICGKAVLVPSMGGTAICPWCDCGEPRPKDTPSCGHGDSFKYWCAPCHSERMDPICWGCGAKRSEHPDSGQMSHHPYCYAFRAQPEDWQLERALKIETREGV